MSTQSPDASAPSGGQETTSTYDYDAAGNMVTRTTGGRDQELTWDAEGNLASVQGAAGSASFVYGPDGDRLIRRQGGEWTLYLPGQEVTWTAGEGTEATRHYEHAGESVAVRENDGTLHWLFSDHNGTAQIAVDAEWGTVQQRRFTAFGQPRSSTEAWPGEKGYVGGTIDEDIGLTQLGARSYDAELGRFISVDPADPQMMQGYSYANNSPVTLQGSSGMLADYASYYRQRYKKRNESNRFGGSYTHSTPGATYGTYRSRSSGSSGGNGGNGGSNSSGVAVVDPYTNNSHERSDAEQAQQQAESGQSWGETTADVADAAWDWTQENWGAISTVAGIGVFAACVVVSAGTCAIAGGVLLASNISMDAYQNNGNVSQMNWKKHTVDAALLGAGAGAGRALAGSARGMFSTPRVRSNWVQNKRSGNPQKREGYRSPSPEGASMMTRANYIDSLHQGMFFNGHGLHKSQIE
ncbi:RHS repeat domain-containing protein [Streptomonospora algeriensis]|uniref:RHS repeat domain-containing protein n=1 Tax=Streptomonospora algeriensis TaxID=995084 RepID=A0ABW3B9X3_9ACTN